MKDDSIYLKHIAEAIAKIETYTAGLTEDSFLGNSLVQDGVIRQFEIIGEAAKHLSPETRGQSDEVPWRCELRNSLSYSNRIEYRKHP